VSEPLLLALGERAPQVAPGAWVAPGAVLVGDVALAEGANVWYASVLRADGASIRIGAGSNVQDGCVLHADTRGALEVGAGVSVGHRAVLHGCTVEDGALVGMGAVVLTGARIGAGSLVAAGAVVLEGTDVPPGSLVAGVPAKVRRPLGEAEVQSLRENATTYDALLVVHRDAEPAATPGR